MTSLTLPSVSAMYLTRKKARLPRLDFGEKIPIPKVEVSRLEYNAT